MQSPATPPVPPDDAAAELRRLRDQLEGEIRALEKGAPAERMCRELGWSHDDLHALYKQSRLVWNERHLADFLEVMTPAEVVEVCRLADGLRAECGAVRSELTQDRILTPAARREWSEQFVLPRLQEVLSKMIAELHAARVPGEAVERWVRDTCQSDPDLRVLYERGHAK